MSKHRPNEIDQTTLMPATIDELAANERDKAEDGTGSRRRPAVLAVVATGVLAVGTAGWLVAGRSADTSLPTVGPTQSRLDPAHVDGFGRNTPSAGAAAPPISRGTPLNQPLPSTTASNLAAGSPATGSNPVAPPPVSTLLSRGRPVNASSIENDDERLHPSWAVDGDINSRWASDYSDHQWITVDLGSSRHVTQVRLRWEVAYGRRYEVQLSPNGHSWNTVGDVDSGDGGIDQHDVDSTGRYVRILCQQRATEWGYSLWEIDVYGY